MPSITRKAHSGRAERRDLIRARLLTAVEDVLAEGESYTELSVERLVSRAGLSRSTFYVYFEDKGDLLQALAEDVLAEVIGAAAAWWDLPPGASRDEVGSGLRTIVDAYKPHQALIAAVVESASYDARVRERFGGMLRQAVDRVAEHIRTGQRSATVRDDVDPDPVASWLTWMTERGLYQLAAPADGPALDRLSESLTAIIWNTLYEGRRAA
jgi:AcrR family transcriptional regulator